MKWSHDTIVEDLLARHDRGSDIGSRALRRTSRALYAAMIHHFGSYRAAIEAAGLDYYAVSHGSAEPWTRERVCQALRQLHKTGQPMYLAAIQRSNAALAMAAHRHFGSYRAAVEAAGFDYASICARAARVWTPRQILGQLKHLAATEADLRSAALCRVHARLWRRAVRYFGSYRNAIAAAGIEPGRLARNPFKQWSPQAVLDELRRLEEQGCSLRPTDLRRSRPSFVAVCERRFGSYRSALDSAGIDYGAVARICGPGLSQQEVIQELRHLADQGGDLRWRAMSRSRPRLLNCARRRFGSYRAAVESAGIPYPPKKPLPHWTEPQVLRTLQELRHDGVDLRHRTVKIEHMPLFSAAKYYFGSYTNAVAHAQLDYDAIVQQHQIH